MPGADGLTGLPDEARLWIFGTDRPLDEAEERALLARVDTFLDGWRAHGHPLAAGREWRLGRFLLVAVDESVAPPTGCSVDALVRMLREAGDRDGYGIVARDPVWFREDGSGEIACVSRPEFRRRSESGEVGAGSTVFDPALTRLSELRAGRWERPAGEGWHRRLLPAEGAGREG